MRKSFGKSYELEGGLSYFPSTTHMKDLKDREHMIKRFSRKQINIIVEPYFHLTDEMIRIPEERYYTTLSTHLAMCFEPVIITTKRKFSQLTEEQRKLGPFGDRLYIQQNYGNLAREEGDLVFLQDLLREMQPKSVRVAGGWLENTVTTLDKTNISKDQINNIAGPVDKVYLMCKKLFPTTLHEEFIYKQGNISPSSNK